MESALAEAGGMACRGTCPGKRPKSGSLSRLDIDLVAQRNPVRAAAQDAGADSPIRPTWRAHGRVVPCLPRVLLSGRARGRRR